MYEELLKTCGLTQNESVVYLTLLKIGKSKSGRIVHKAKISGGKIYETLNKLVDKGLVKSVNENGVMHFLANEPDTLISYLKDKEKILHEKEKELSKILPELKSLKKQEEDLKTVFFIKGFKGISSVVYKSLEKSKSIKIMGVVSSKDEKYNNFWRNWHRERIKSKKKAKILFSDKNTDYWKFFKKLSYTNVRAIEHFTPSAIMIIDDETFIFSYEKEFICIHIFSNQITTSFSEFFNDLWKIAEK
jgi:sugar-specific transcriptional regulator TrmB